MGSASSKAVKSAAGAAKRQYPQKVPSHISSTAPAPAPAPSPASPTTPAPLEAKGNAISYDGMDPEFARLLRSLGAVKPSSTMSNSSTFNTASNPRPDGPSQRQGPTLASVVPAIQVTDARARLAEEAEAEFAAIGRRGFRGREFLDVMLLRQALRLRDEKGLKAEEIERKLGLRHGVLQKLGRRGVVGDVSSSGDLEP